MNSISSEGLVATAYRPDIDGLRAVAILSVVTFHAFPNAASGGFAGVDVFFVISGFLISNIIFRKLNQGDFSFAEFYAHRIKRIFPALLLVLASCFLTGWFTLLPDEFRQLGKHIAAGAGFAQNFVLVKEAGYFDTASELKPLVHLWSLAIEEQFYLLYPAFLWGVWRLRLRLLPTLLAVGAISFIANVSSIGNDAVKTFFFPQTRFWELFAGSVLAHLYLYKRDPTLSSLQEIFGWRSTWLLNGLSLCGLMLLITSIFGLHQGSGFPGWWALLPVFGAFLMIGAGPDAWLNRKLLSSPPMIFIGLISYPLYLWHWPLLSFTRIVESGQPSFWIKSGLVLLSLLLSWMTYRFIERPIRFGKKTGVKTVCLSVLLVVIGLTGYGLFTGTGYESRYKLTQHAGSEISRYLDRVIADENYIPALKLERQVAIRAPYCQFNKPGQSFEEYKQGLPACLKLESGKRNVLIVGDSHAADLYVAASSAYQNHNFLQVTGAGCAPDLDHGKGCFELISFGIDFAKSHPVDAVVIAGRWQTVNYAKLLSIVDTLKTKGMKVYLVGPPKEFTSDVYKFIARRRDGQSLEYLATKYVNLDVEKINTDLRSFSRDKQIEFIDRIRIFCGEDGACPLLDQEGDLLIWDYGHLSVKGARLLGGKLLRSEIVF